MKRIFGADARSSLLLRTVAAMTAAFVLFTAVTAFITYRQTTKSALEAQDSALAEVASALARAGVADPYSETPEDWDAFRQGRRHGRGPGHMRRHMMRENRSIIAAERARDAEALLEAWMPEGSPAAERAIPTGEHCRVHVRSNAPNFERPADAVFEEPLRGGFSNRTIEGSPHRLCVIFLPDGRYTAVAAPMSLIEARAAAEALRAAAPLLILMPLLLIVVALVLRQSFVKLRRAAEEVRSRDASHLEPLNLDSLPKEAAPFGDAVNDLLARVQAARTREIRFTADAAHELRSPLTSLMIEAEHLSRLELPPEARAIVDNLAGGLNRSVHQVSQLLLFARAQAGETSKALEKDAEPWYFSEAAGELLEPLLSAMEEKSIGFSVEGIEEREAPISGVSRTALTAILRNLLENAVRYSPEGGSVKLEFRRGKDALVFVVSDTGAGIPAEERERVFDPFYRIPGTKAVGTGLGLAIVKTYADMIGAEVSLADARPDDKDRPGLSVTVRVRTAQG